MYGCEQVDARHTPQPEGVISVRLASRSFPVAFRSSSLKGRASAFLLAVAINLLLIIVLLTLNAVPPAPPPFSSAPTLVDLVPEADRSTATEAAETETSADAAEPVPAEPEQEIAAAPSARIIPPVPVPDDRPLPFLVLTREDMAASDIARFGMRPPGSGSGERVASRAGDSERVGTAPNGEPLYRAEWHRRPTSAELSAYLPATMPREGWGLVACRTVARFRVEDCVELGDSPPGSRLAGAVRQAAWQFLVRPPRVGGKLLVGSWVQIRIDYTESKVD